MTADYGPDFAVGDKAILDIDDHAPMMNRGDTVTVTRSWAPNPGRMVANADGDEANVHTDSLRPTESE